MVNNTPVGPPRAAIAIFMDESGTRRHRPLADKC